ncbi:hypothetical protein PVT71_14570 [Salipiger sp. H15]|uniref:Glycosyltransferase n=1 Tax=Alloyangia sp. H15 TaxID=3029062 RepID=A0AAU8ALW7_9RHOB
MTIVACVLRSGGDFRPEHVDRLRMQVAAHLPGAEFRCLTDMPVSGSGVLPLRCGWPGWWSKMEIFSPDVSGDLLMMDLDSAIVGDLGDMAGIGRLAIMRDVYRPAGLQSSVMFLPKAARGEVWGKWISNPGAWMRRFRRGGDQAFLETLWLDRAARWQDVLPGQVVSFKADRCAEQLPQDARFVAFHGRPRPWDVGW